MRIVIAPDSFKGSMSSLTAAQAINCGIKEVFPDAETILVPMADGGEGTVEALANILNGQEVTVDGISDPLGRPIRAAYSWVESTSTAIIETASASGLPLLEESELDPDHASTYGTGELIKHALDKKARKIILGLGGSATVDAGTGCFEALGVQFRDQKGERIKANGATLAHISTIDLTSLDSRLKDVEVVVASDVTNPLLGEEGAISVFGPQKGVSDITRFEAGMNNYANRVSEKIGMNLENSEGSGAAGGFGFSLLAFLDPIFMSGFSLIAEHSCLKEQMKSSHLVITGEGKLDSQTLYGKVPSGISELAKSVNVPAIAFAGTSTIIEDKEKGIMTVLPIIDEPMELKEAIRRGPDLLYRASKRFMTLYQWISEEKGE
ncbi:glycerate kinase [Pseudalkalibacillus hwajinpoensis]|uniref:glycerate kinase n=1 Tax=Guptibacillus hwajinpoensis TaxID=208199 RepID=UPI001CD6BE97|nr:glycerate kinase [Pseudalkalibacillus hwajinpoensis]MCA0991577.1 glycerate kinase [Pseudalkalibacillus hwajinpoensis]